MGDNHGLSRLTRLSSLTLTLTGVLTGILTWVLIGIIALLVLTGGIVFPLKHGFIEASQTNPWVIALGFLTLFQLRKKAVPPLIKTLQWIDQRLSEVRHPQRITLAVLLIFSSIAALIHTFRLARMQTAFADHGVIQHVLASTWQRNPFQCEVCINGTFLADHLAFTLALLSPIAGLFHRPEPLFFCQSLALAAGVFLLLRWGPLKNQPETWLLSLFIVLCHSHFRFSASQVDLREDHLAFLFLSIAAISLIQITSGRRWFALGFLSCTLAILSKENVALVIPFLCGAGYLQTRADCTPAQRKVPMIFLGLLTLWGILWVWVNFKILMPHYLGSSRNAHEIVIRFAGLGTTPLEVLKNLLLHPGTTVLLLLENAFSPAGLHYLLLLLIPWAFFLWKGKTWLIAALPGILMNLLSGKPEQRSLQWHYELIIYPFLILAVFEGLRRSSKKERLLGLFLALAFSERWPMHEIQKFWPSSAQWQTTQWFYRIPPQGLLGAGFNQLGPAATRAEIRLYHSFGKTLSQANASSMEDSIRQYWDSFRNENYFLNAEQKKVFWINQAQWLLFDLRDPIEKSIVETRPNQWKLDSTSPDGNYVVLKNLSPSESATGMRND